MILQLQPTRGSGLSVLITRMSGIEDLSVCVQSALGALVAMAAGVGNLDCIDEGRVKAMMAGDHDLADLLRRALEELESELVALDEVEETEARAELAIA